MSEPAASAFVPAADAVSLAVAGGTATVTVTGDLDLATGPAFERAFSAALELADSWVVDLTAVAFIDSCGMRALLRARREALSREGSLQLRPGADAVMRALQVAGVAAFFTFAEPDQAS